jgi:hypothetical protein
MRNPIRRAAAFVALVLQLLLPSTASAIGPAWPGFGDLCSARPRPAPGAGDPRTPHRRAHDFAHCPMCAAGVACATPPVAAALPAARRLPLRATTVLLAPAVAIAPHSLAVARGPPAGV